MPKKAAPPPSKRPLDRLRALCLALPEAHEVEAWSEPTFRVKNKIFAMYADSDNHHGAGRPCVWVKSTHLIQDMLIHEDADRYFAPPYVGPKGWIGIRLDKRPTCSATRISSPLPSASRRSSALGRREERGTMHEGRPDRRPSLPRWCRSVARYACFTASTSRVTFTS